jgi:hypothetical protein
MSETSTAFERRVERIHHLLEGEDAVVTWNDHIPDPDNPSQPRQIDVTIRRGETLTIVECRIHKDPQDVTWIEELIGRRASLRADAAIAVSNSGFTQGAEAKAIAFGIILRDFDTLTQEEIRNWGKQRKVRLIFYEFTNNAVTLRLPSPPILPIVITDYAGSPVYWRGMFEPIMADLNSDPNRRFSDAAFGYEMEGDAEIIVSGEQVQKIKLTCDVRRVARDVSLTGVVAYADPSAQTQASQAIVGTLNLATSEIVEASDTVLLVVDLSQIDIPDNCLFHGIDYDFGRPVEIRAVQVVGANDAMKFQNTMTFRFEGTLRSPATG